MKYLYFAKLPPTSSIHQQKKQAYLQSFKWYHILKEVPAVDSSQHCFKEEDDEWLPQIT
jgi:hypothetical protein